MNDVAERAGVSQTTVSFVLNDAPNVNIPQETRARIWAAIEELGYRRIPGLIQFHRPADMALDWNYKRAIFRDLGV